MKSIFYLSILISILISDSSKIKPTIQTTTNVFYLQKDKEILEQVLQKYSTEKNSSMGDLIVKVGTYFKETPYVAHTLEAEPEQLVINLRELDCTTFAENCLAIARTIKSEKPSFEKFTRELQNIRYRNGIINGYPSRIHYFSDWIFENNKRNFIEDVSEEIAKTPYPLKVNFMSTHPGSYIQLKDSSLIQVIAKQEKEISSRAMFYIPEEILVEKEHLLKNGDIVGITTSVKGLDIMHVGILVRKNNRIHFLNASSISMKVELTEKPLEDYLKNNKSATGIMVARPNKTR